VTENQKRLCKEIVKYCIYLARQMENESECTFLSLKDMERLLTNNENDITHIRAVENLLKTAEIYCGGSKLCNKIQILKEELNENILSQARIKTENTILQNPTEIEQAAYMEEVSQFANILASYVTIATASSLSGINHSTIKQACTKGKLLGGRKVGKTWEVNFQEVKEHWNIQENHTER